MGRSDRHQRSQEKFEWRKAKQEWRRQKQAWREERRAWRRARREERLKAFLALLGTILAFVGLTHTAGQLKSGLRVPLMVLLVVFGGAVIGSLALGTLLILALSGALQHMGDFILGFGLWAAIVATLGFASLAVWWARRPSVPAESWTKHVTARLAGVRIRLTTPRDPKRNPGAYRKRAGAYRQRMQRLIKARRPGPLTDVLESVLPKVMRWEERVGQLAGRLQAFEGDALNQRDAKEVPQAVAQLERQIPLEADRQVRQQMVSTLNGYRAQQALLTDLARVMQRTRLQLDDTLASMGTIYSQVQMIDALDIDSPEAARIAGEIDEQVQRLNDLLAALPEAYASANPRASTLDAGTDAATGIGTGAAGDAGIARVENAEIAARRARLEHEAGR